MGTTFFILSIVLAVLTVYLLWKWLSAREDVRWYKENYAKIEARLEEEKRLRREIEYRGIADKDDAAKLVSKIRHYNGEIQKLLNDWTTGKN